MNQNIKDRLDVYTKELMPAEGKAKTLAGELVRALNRIGYRYYNDGDQIGIDYGNETCNPAARFIQSNTTIEIKRLIESMWDCYNESMYEAGLESLITKTLDYIDAKDLKNKPNTEDMLTYTDPSDNDYIFEEDEYYWDTEEEEEEDEVD